MGELLASGRTADVFDAGPGRVLRTYRDGRDAAAEVTIMRAVAAAGYPVPRVLEAGGPDMVLERVEGPTLAGYLGKRPWQVRWGARLLGDLIDRLATIPRPAGLAEPFGAGEVLIHLDLHSMNVLLGPDGPRVIDWPNSVWGPAGLDRAHSWLLITTSEVPVPALIRRPARLGQQVLARGVLGRSAQTRRWIPTVTEHRLQDPNVTPFEAVRLRAILDRHSTSVS